VTTPHLAGHPAASQQAIVEAALLMLRQMGLSPDDLVTVPRDRPPVPTFAEYVPVVSAAVTGGSTRAATAVSHSSPYRNTSSGRGRDIRADYRFSDHIGGSVRGRRSQHCSR
jgi:hypothetical protein